MALTNLSSSTPTNPVPSLTPSKTFGSLKASSSRLHHPNQSIHTSHRLAANSLSLFLPLCQTPLQQAPEMSLRLAWVPTLPIHASASTFSAPAWDVIHTAMRNGVSLRYLHTDITQHRRASSQLHGLKQNECLLALLSPKEVAN